MFYMKKLPFNATKGLLLGSGAIAVIGACVVAVNANNLFKAKNENISLIENGILETQKAKILVDAENEVNESKAQVEEANKEIEKATLAKEKAKKEVEAALEAITKAEKDKKLAEDEVKNAKTSKERAIALEKVKAASEAVNKAKATKNEANAKVQNAEKTIAEAQENKKVAEQRVQKAEDNKKAIEEEIRINEEAKANAQKLANEQAKKNVEENTKKEVKEQTPILESKTELEKKAPTESKTTKENKNATVTNPSTNENRSLTDEQLKKMLEAAKKGEEADRQKYIDEYTEKYGHAPVEEKQEVEFHFYSTLNPLTVRLYDHNNYYTSSRCGETGSGCIWFAEFSCNLDQCVGFPDSNTNELKGNVLYARRASIKEYTMKAPDARPGYKFKQWEIISDNKNKTVNGNTGIAYKYIAIYEKN